MNVLACVSLLICVCTAYASALPTTAVESSSLVKMAPETPQEDLALEESRWGGYGLGGGWGGHRGWGGRGWGGGYGGGYGYGGGFGGGYGGGFGGGYGGGYGGGFGGGYGGGYGWGKR